MTDTEPSPTEPTEPSEPSEPAEPDTPERERLQISVVQVAASSLAAVTAAVVCSLFGVAGTIIGTAIASVAATIGSAVYAHSIRRTRERLQKMPRPQPPAVLAEQFSVKRRDAATRLRALPWRRIIPASVAVFIVAMGVVTAIELGIGASLAHAFRGGSGGSTTLGFSTHRRYQPASTTPATSPTPSVSPSPSPSTTTAPPTTSAPPVTTSGQPTSASGSPPAGSSSAKPSLSVTL